MTNAEMTTEEVIIKVQRKVDVAERTVRRWIRALKIKPLGTIRTNPTRWPADTAQRVLEARGVANGKHAPTIHGMDRLRSEKTKAKGGAK